MAQRDDTFQKFGPILLEAACLVIVELQNELRRNQGMPEITEQDVLDLLNNHLAELEPYVWMQEET